MAEITWIKLTTNIFEDEKINFIESLPDADMLIVIWLKLLTMAGKINDGGFIYLTEKMPYTPEMLANKFNRPLNTIKLALKTFQELEMIELIENKIFISKWEKHQSIDEMAKIKEQTRQRVARHREKKQLECNVTVTLPVTQCNAIEENKKEKEKEKKNIFIKPSIEEIKEYCQQRQNNINANSFYDYYQSKGWMIGKNKMKDWKAAIRTWEAKEKPTNTNNGDEYYANYNRV